MARNTVPQVSQFLSTGIARPNFVLISILPWEYSRAEGTTISSIITNQGLQRIGIQASQATAYSAVRHIQTMAVDDSSTAFIAGATTLGSPTNLFDAAFDGTPTRSNQTISHVMTIPTGSGNFTIRRISLHDDTATNTTGSSSTLVGGIDAQALTKSADFSLAFTVNITYTSV